MNVHHSVTSGTIFENKHKKKICMLGAYNNIVSLGIYFIETICRFRFSQHSLTTSPHLFRFIIVDMRSISNDKRSHLPPASIYIIMIQRKTCGVTCYCKSPAAYIFILHKCNAFWTCTCSNISLYSLLHRGVNSLF